MSGILAWYCRKGAPVPLESFHAVLTAASYHGPDGTRYWSAGRVALGHVKLATTPESELETQPARSRTAPLCLTLDGRLDNRSELIEALAAEAPAGSIGDADLILMAYQRWGIDCLDHLVGDFAFALWDGTVQRLFCARDPMGVRPFYYLLTPRTFVAASGLQELLSCRMVPLDVNEAMVGEYLTGTLHSTTETLYEHVHRLAPGHLMMLSEQGVRTARYWHPHRIRELQLSTGDHAERFLELFTTVVKSQSRSNRPLAADLSGGLDSSTVVCTLAKLQQRAELSQPFEAFTLAFPGLACDETEYAALVPERYACPWHRVIAEPPPPVDYDALARESLDFPGYPNGTTALYGSAVMRELGTRVVLTGNGGDGWLDGAPAYARACDFMTTGQLPALKKELLAARWPWIVNAGARQVLVRALDRVGLGWPKRAVRRRRLPPWLRPIFVQRNRLAERISPPDHVPKGWSWSRAIRLQRSTGGWFVHPLEMQARMFAGLHLEARNPFLDRRLVEYLLAVPEQVCASATTHRLLVRKAMRDILPERIRTRRDKAEFSNAFYQAMATHPVRNTMLRRQSAIEQDWLDIEILQREYERYLRGNDVGRLWSLWGTYGIRTWCNALAGPRESPSTTSPPAAEVR